MDQKDNPLVGGKETALLAVGFLAFAGLLIYIIQAIWPTGKGTGWAAEICIFDARLNCVSPDQRLFIMVAVAGMLGAIVHALTSFADYVGNQQLRRSWVWWLILRIPIGAALAVIIYLLIRGGLLTTNGATSNDPGVQPYGIAAISAMVGLFSKQATDKLAEVFDTMFKTSKGGDDVRGDKLRSQKPELIALAPANAAVGSPDLLIEVQGKGFTSDSKVLLDGTETATGYVSETKLTFTLNQADLQANRTIKVKIQTPGGTSTELPFVVGAG